MTFNDWGIAAQIASTLVAIAGVLFSVWLSVKALREVQLDRHLRHRPFVLFEPGGWKVPVELRDIGKTLPGMDRSWAEKAFRDSPPGSLSVLIRRDTLSDGRLVRPGFGALSNFGNGPAMEVHLCWIPSEIEVRGETFQIDSSKYTDPRYRPTVNTDPSSPSHIRPSGTAILTGLPAFIVKDHDRKVTSVSGHLVISYKDVFAECFESRQEFRIKTWYDDEEPFVIITFGQEMTGNDPDA